LENSVAFFAIGARENEICIVEFVGTQEKFIQGSVLSDHGAIQGFFQINGQANIVFYGQPDFPCEIG
jgi:hypothetical protein